MTKKFYLKPIRSVIAGSIFILFGLFPFYLNIALSIDIYKEFVFLIKNIFGFLGILVNSIFFGLLYLGIGLMLNNKKILKTQFTNEGFYFVRIDKYRAGKALSIIDSMSVKNNLNFRSL